VLDDLTRHDHVEPGIEPEGVERFEITLVQVCVAARCEPREALRVGIESVQLARDFRQLQMQEGAVG
jgi:hypothetical protein